MVSVKSLERKESFVNGCLSVRGGVRTTSTNCIRLSEEREPAYIAPSTNEKPHQKFLPLMVPNISKHVGFQVPKF